jgi:biotin carboxyl carrier protein
MFRYPANKTKGDAKITEICSPMPGTILRILVKIGDTVTDDTVVAVHEAMKMENSIFAACEGTIKETTVSEGDVVESLLLDL